MTDVGFTASVIVSTGPDAAFEYFIRAELFARWFVVGGFTTPAGEIRLEPEPGGAISGVMVSDDGSTRIPFELRYGRLDPPRLVQFLFEESTDAVTIAVHATDDGRAVVSYHKPYGSADARGAAQSMLDAMAASIEGGT